jgi:hypothetical protein
MNVHDRTASNVDANDVAGIVTARVNALDLYPVRSQS